MTIISFLQKLHDERHIDWCKAILFSFVPLLEKTRLFFQVLNTIFPNYSKTCNSMTNVSFFHCRIYKICSLENISRFKKISKESLLMLKKITEAKVCDATGDAMKRTDG